MPDLGVRFGCHICVASVEEDASKQGLSVGDTLLEPSRREGGRLTGPAS